MRISLELTADQQKRLEEEANRLRLSPEELAQAALEDFLAPDDDADFRRAAAHVIAKNSELYRRLA